MLEPAQYVDGLGDGRLFEPDGLEPPLERGVLLDMAAVLVGRGCADHLQLAARQRRLHDVGGVDSALGGARSDDRVQLVDEQDDLALSLFHLVDDRLEALFELAAEFAPRDDARHVERQHALVAERFRDVAGDDALGEALGDRRLADARSAYDHGVVLRAARQRLHDAANLGGAADYRVNLSLAGQRREVDGVPVQRLVAALGARVGHPAPAAHLLEGLVHPLLVDPVTGQDARRFAALIERRRDEEVLRADVLVAQPLLLAPRRIEHRERPWRWVHLRGLRTGLGRTFERLLELGADLGRVYAELFEQLDGHALRVLEQREHDVLDVPLRVAEAPDHIVGGADRLPRLLGEVFLPEHHWNHHPFAFLAYMRGMFGLRHSTIHLVSARLRPRQRSASPYS